MNKQTCQYNIQTIFKPLTLATVLILAACSADDPVKEDSPELITKATLTFTPIGGGDEIVVTATDPDGEGVEDISVDSPINLKSQTTYDLSIELINGLVDPTSPEYNISDEVSEESDEHLFFFGWTNNVFSSPAGDGNIDNRADEVNYNDQDASGLPLGLLTTWITAGSAASGSFRVILKHQPGLKSETSSSTSGESDLDVEATINIIE